MGFLPSVEHGIGLLPEVLEADDNEIRRQLERDDRKVVRISLVRGLATDGDVSRLGRRGPRYYAVTVELPNGGRLRHNIKLGGADVGFQVLP